MKTTILLFGGPSRECLVSVASAQNVMKVLPSPTTMCWYWSPKGAVCEVSAADLLNHQNCFTQPLQAECARQWPSIELALDEVNAAKSLIFNALHGLKGEDGYIQDLCEARGLALTGSSAQASRLSFDKEKTKAALEGSGVLTAPCLLVNNSKESYTKLLAFFQCHKKIVIKPNRDGSSFGLAIISQEDELKRWREQIDEDSHEQYLAEKFIGGIEITVGVIQGMDGMRSLPSVEIVAEQNRIFDYAGKYLGQGVKEVIPARISPKLEEKAQRIASQVHEIVGLRGYSRSDLIIDEASNIFFLEVNSLPGLSSQSLVPQELNAVGITMKEFIRDQLKLIEVKEENSSEAFVASSEEFLV